MPAIDDNSSAVPRVSSQWVWIFACGSCLGLGSVSARAAGPGPTVPIGILGDGDSHASHDDIRSQAAQGPYSEVNLSWPEALAKLRGDQVDLGTWGIWGGKGTIAELLRWLGYPGRAPKKRDFEHNLANRGASCRDLLAFPQRQAATLAGLIARAPKRWDRGVVVIRIGVNDLGQQHHLETYAAHGLDLEAQEAVGSCVRDVEGAVAKIREVHPTVAVVLSGVFDNSNWVPLTEKWRSPGELRNIRAVLEYFNDRLRQAAERSPGVIFLENQRWWTQRFGDRDENGVPHYVPLSLGGATSITNSQGDHPQHAVQSDGRTGTVWNLLWANHLIQAIDEGLGAGVSPIREVEIADLVDPDGTLGIAPPRVEASPPVVHVSPGELELDALELPFTLPLSVSEDPRDPGVTATAVATAIDEQGMDLPLFGSGTGLQLRPTRHHPGRYVLSVSVRDRAGRTVTATTSLRIHP